MRSDKIEKSLKRQLNTLQIANSRLKNKLKSKLRTIEGLETKNKILIKDLAVREFVIVFLAASIILDFVL